MKLTKANNLILTVDDSAVLADILAAYVKANTGTDGSVPLNIIGALATCERFVKLAHQQIDAEY